MLVFGFIIWLKLYNFCKLNMLRYVQSPETRDCTAKSSLPGRMVKRNKKRNIN